jgi:hypothetical protein
MNQAIAHHHQKPRQGIDPKPEEDECKAGQGQYTFLGAMSKECPPMPIPHSQEIMKEVLSTR